MRDMDIFGYPVKISYQGKSSHTTYFGGLVSMIICSTMITYVGWRLILFKDRERDEYWTSLSVSDWQDIGSI